MQDSREHDATVQKSALQCGTVNYSTILPLLPCTQVQQERKDARAQDTTVRYGASQYSIQPSGAPKARKKKREEEGTHGKGQCTDMKCHGVR